ncbi:DUF1236 domain-containing protein [Antarcticirhabdus aurantiaca]|uniref:DUF1236 domain-containing protein n=1 Tax=Antarcticirhabdus aurantiaca TaxID=2606717 RepID=A0ACD4NLY7_9HYPH|nr:DUF1236 domain-containing protein [Antarcticirhabdus aurantiaca]WAJ27869.1 DUF1236 domain-containing protein [Jeongeuplla avenae]
MKKAILFASVVLVALGAPAMAQTATTETTTTQTTTTTTVPAEVRTYVTGQEATSVSIDGDVVVGEALPETVTITPIPDNAEYGYAVVNNKRVVINPTTRTVIEVVE